MDEKTRAQILGVILAVSGRGIEPLENLGARSSD
jgi:hypothetical protein